MSRLILPLGSVLFLFLFLGHIGACIVVNMADTGSAVTLPAWLVHAARLFVAI